MAFLDPENIYSSVNLIFILAFILLGAAIFISFSGFVKYNVVLNIIKNAIGTQQIPPAMVVNLLAALMALSVIWGYITPGLERVKPYFFESKMQPEEEASPFDNQNISEFGGEFDDSNKSKLEGGNLYYLIDDIFEYFPELLNYAKQKTEKLNELIDLPDEMKNAEGSFKYFLGSLIYDLYIGFEIGLKLYIVFVSIDFLVAVVLSGVGMTMLSPTVISTPIKLAVFYFSDSWTMLFKTMQ